MLFCLVVVVLLGLKFDSEIFVVESLVDAGCSGFVVG
jgi:hypothetical protein